MKAMDKNQRYLKMECIRQRQEELGITQEDLAFSARI